MRPQLILIDGYNVIRRTPALAAAERVSLEAAREALIGLVIGRYRGTPHRVLVVFDGQGAAETTRPLRGGIGSQQIFSAAGTTADEVIRRRVEDAQEEWGARIAVYSDDWEISSHAASQGARPGAVDELTRHLTQAPRLLLKRARHHEYLRARERDDASDAPRQPRAGNAHKAPRRRR